MNSHVQILGSVPIVERLLQAQPSTVPIKQRHRILQVLACTCRALQQSIGKHTSTWQWAQRMSMCSHVAKTWRRHADYRWLHEVPYWSDQFRHATDLWFAQNGPTFLKNGGLCRVADGYWFKSSHESRLLWIDYYFGSCKQVSSLQTETLHTKLQMCRLPTGHFSVMPWRNGDFTVGTHVYCGDRIIDDLVEEAAYRFGDTEYKIGRGRWHDVQRCYLPTLMLAFGSLELTFTLRDASIDDRDVWCSHTLFILDHDRHKLLLQTQSYQYPYDRESTLIVERGLLRVERKRTRARVIE